MAGSAAIGAGCHRSGLIDASCRQRLNNPADGSRVNPPPPNPWSGAPCRAGRQRLPVEALRSWALERPETEESTQFACPPSRSALAVRRVARGRDARGPIHRARGRRGRRYGGPQTFEEVWRTGGPHGRSLVGESERRAVPIAMWRGGHAALKPGAGGVLPSACECGRPGHRGSAVVCPGRSGDPPPTAVGSPNEHATGPEPQAEPSLPRRSSDCRSD
jgi:hypothetical protein